MLLAVFEVKLFQIHFLSLIYVADSKDESESSGYESNTQPDPMIDNRQGTLTYRCASGESCTCTVFNHPHRKCSGFPFLEVHGESYEATQLDYFLKEQTENIKFGFADLREDTFQELKISVPFDNVQQHIKRLTESKPDGCVGKSSNFRELEDSLCQNYCSWFNYKIIKEIRKKYLFPNSQDKVLECYEEKLSIYCKRRCFESSQSFHPKPVSQNMKTLVFKVEKSFHEYTLEQVNKITHKVASVINCPEYAIYVRSLREGCVEVSCYILSQAALSHLNQDQISQLRYHDIVSLKIEGIELTEVKPKLCLILLDLFQTHADNCSCCIVILSVYRVSTMNQLTLAMVRVTMQRVKMSLTRQKYQIP